MHKPRDDGYARNKHRGGEIVAEFEHKDKNGKFYLQVRKTEHHDFYQFHWVEKGVTAKSHWASGEPKGPKIPYKLPELIKHPLNELLFIAEGEKDADTVIFDLGLMATTNSGGAGKWWPDLNEWFKGRQNIVILEDNDKAGRRHVLKVAGNLINIAAQVRIVTFRHMPEKSDVTNWVEAGGTKDELLALAQAAPALTASDLLRACIRQSLQDCEDENEIVAAFLDSEHSLYEHVQENGGENYIKKQIEYALNNAGIIADKNKVIIRLPAGQRDEVWREVERALRRANCPVYVRGGQLVQPLWRWEKADDEDDRYVLTTKLVIFNRNRLADVVAHHAVRFQKFNKKEEKWINSDPPNDVIETLLDVLHYDFRTIKGIINSPTMRPDGSLLVEQGYDDGKTELWYKSSGDVELPPIAERPTEEEAKAKLAILNELLDGFPFEKETEDQKKSVARSIALAGMFTTVLRGAFSAAPIFLVVAPRTRTGKTYLIYLISVLATGHIPVSTAGSRNPEEMEKRIETAALSGRPIIHLNNLPNGTALESEALSQLSTEGHVTVRKLGRFEEGLCDCRATTVFANGNNILVVGDLVPRTPICRLDANRADPWSRKFNSDPIQLVRRDRGKYLAAIFTIARAFKAAGSPEQKQRCVVNGYDQWSRLVQQSLMWLGMPDPFGEMEDAIAQDPEQEKLQGLLDVLKKYRSDLGERFTAGDCGRLAEEKVQDGFGRPIFKRQDLRDLMTFHGRIDTTHFGRVLSSYQGQWDQGWRYKRIGQTDGRAAYGFETKKPEQKPELETF